MKKVIVASVMAIALTACGGGSKKAQLEKMCLAEDDTTAAECSCMAEQAIDKLDGKMVNMLIKAGKSGDTDGSIESAMSDMTTEEMGQFMAFGMSMAATCGLD